MSELIELKDFLGDKKVLVGTGKSDVVLNPFGNVWIKTGNKTVKLSEYVKDIASSLSSNTNENTEQETKPTIVQDIYVKKEGDIMSGSLTFSKPFIIQSKQQIANLNASYIAGYGIDSLGLINGASINVQNAWNFRSGITSSNVITDGFSTSDGLIKYANGILTVQCPIENGQETPVVEQTRYSIEDAEPDEPTGEYDAYYDLDCTINLKDIYPDYDYNRYDKCFVENVSTSNTVIFEGDDISIPSSNYFGVGFSYSDPIVETSDNLTDNDLYISATGISVTSISEDQVAYVIIPEASLSSILTVDGEAYDDSMIDRISDGYAYMPFNESVTGDRFVLSGICVEADHSIESRVDIFSPDFNPEVYDTIVVNDQLCRMYKYIPYYNSLFYTIGVSIQVGSILRFDDNTYAVVTNSFSDYSVVSSVGSLSGEYTIIGNINRNAIISEIGGTQYIGLDIPITSNSIDIHKAIQVDFKSNFCHNDIYYYIYSQNYKLNDSSIKLKGDLMIVTKDNSIDIFNLATKQLVSIGENVSISGLKDSVPSEPNILYKENGYIKIS